MRWDYGKQISLSQVPWACLGEIRVEWRDTTSLLSGYMDLGDGLKL